MLCFYLIFLPGKAKSEILKDIIVTGNKRTTKKAILFHARIKLGSNMTQRDLQDIEENLRRINQIRFIGTTFKDGILTINIEDKWTLIPVPMITQSGKYSNRGLLLYEDNIFGTLGTFAPGISWSNNTLNAIFYYQDESLFSEQTGIKVLLLRKSELVEFKRRDVPVDTFESFYDSVLITPNYLYRNHVFKAGPLYTNKKIYSKEGKLEKQNKSTGFFFRHHLNDYQALDVMYEGLVTTYDLYAIRGIGHKWYFRHEADARWSYPLGVNFLNLGIHAHTVNDPSYFYTKILGGDEGLRGYDKSSLPAMSNAGILAQYQQNILPSIFLTPFYEFNNTRLIKPSGGGILNEHAIGIGLRYYFKKISIPALIFDFGRNLNDKSNHYLLNIGASL